MDYPERSNSSTCCKEKCRHEESGHCGRNSRPSETLAFAVFLSLRKAFVRQAQRSHTKVGGCKSMINGGFSCRETENVIPQVERAFKDPTYLHEALSNIPPSYRSHEDA